MLMQEPHSLESWGYKLLAQDSWKGRIFRLIPKLISQNLKQERFDNYISKAGES